MSMLFSSDLLFCSFHLVFGRKTGNWNGLKDGSNRQIGAKAKAKMQQLCGGRAAWDFLCCTEDYRL